MLSDPSLAGTSLDPYYHVCAFFGSREDEYRVLAPFYRETLAGGEKLLHVIDSALTDDHTRRMEAEQVPAHACLASRQFEIFGWEDTYLRNGVFDPDQMLVAVQQVIEAARAAGYPRTRIMGNMNWAVQGAPGSDRLIEYEIRVNEVLARERQPAVCVYDLKLLTGTLMLDLIRAHPLTLVNGVVHHNQFFTPPEQFLGEIRHRASVSNAAFA